MSKKVKNNICSLREKQLRDTVLQLRRELSDATEGAQELSRALDGVVAAIVRQCGTRTESGYRLSLPAVRIGAGGRVSTKQEGDCYVITVTDALSEDTAHGKDTPEIG